MKTKFLKYPLLILMVIFLLMINWSFLQDRAINLFQKFTRAERLLSVKKRIIPELKNELNKKGFKIGDSVFLRIFKESNELELWMSDGEQYQLFKTYPIYYWSGKLGPKLKEGDKQSPEGFYKVDLNQLNSLSSYHLSFNIGFPNKFDRSLNRTGSFIMIHGDCVSIGCYAMTNEVIEEIYILVEAAIRNTGQPLNIHAFPFRMTSQKMEENLSSKWISFWWNLKIIHDYFESSKKIPHLEVVNEKYVIDKGAQE